MIASIQPEIPKLPTGKWVGLILIFVVGFIIASILPKCESDPVIINNEQKKATVKKLKLQADSIKNKSAKADSVRIGYVKKWRNRKPQLDSIPCPDALAEVITLTDSIITVDSTQISELKAEIFIKDLVIANQDTIIKNDSIAIYKLNKQLKRQRNKTKIAWFFTAVIGTVAALK